MKKDKKTNFLDKFFSSFKGRRSLFDVDLASLTVAFLALLASQFPPIYVLFSRPDIQVETSNRLGLSHTLGSINLIFGTQIGNEGSSSATLKNVNAILIAEDNPNFKREFSIEKVISPNYDEVFRPVPFLSGMVLSGDLYFVEQPDPSILDQELSIYVQAEQDILHDGKLSNATIGGIKRVSQRINSFSVGKYTLLFSFHFQSDDGEFIRNKCYSFELRESHANSFNNETDLFISTFGKERPTIYSGIPSVILIPEASTVCE